MQRRWQKPELSANIPVSVTYPAVSMVRPTDQVLEADGNVVRSMLHASRERYEKEVGIDAQRQGDSRVIIEIPAMDVAAELPGAAQRLSVRTI